MARPIEPLDQYAAAYGVTTEEGHEALLFQQEAIDLVNDLAERFPDVYANAAFANGADFGLTVFVAGDETAALEDTIKAFEIANENVRDRVVLGDAPYSLNELTMISQDLAERLSFLDEDSPIMVVLDSTEGSVTVELPESDATLMSSLTTALASMGVPVDYVVTGKAALPTACDPPVTNRLEGGRRFGMRTSSAECGSIQEGCSTGFAARLDGYDGVSSSGHCLGTSSTHIASVMYANGTQELTSTRTYRRVDNSNADIRFNREKHTSSYLGRLYLWDQVWGRVTGFTHQHPEDTWVCVKGANTAHVDHGGDHGAAFSCGPITNNTVNPGGWRNSMAFARVDLYYGSIRPGDSGSAVINSYTSAADITAHGIEMGAYGSGHPPYDAYYYSKIAFGLNELGGATLYTG